MGIQVIKAGGGTAGLNLAGGVALSASLVSVVDAFANVSPLQLATASIGLNAPTFLTIPTWTNTLGSKDGFYSQQTVAVASAGTGVFRMIRNSYTINNTAAQTGSITGYFLNATETALNGITHNLMNLQVGGVSKFNVSNGGIAIASQEFSSSLFRCTTPGNGFYLQTIGFLTGTSTGVMRLSDNADTSFGRLQLGGTTSSFPAIKRNGAAIDFRLADDSGYCSVNALNGSFKTTNANTNGTLTFINNSATTIASITDSGSALTMLQFRADGVNFTDLGTKGIVIQSSGYGTNANASSILDMISTTKGFLMPRMTQAQILAIATPANGLQVYNTDLAQPCFYDGTGWKKISHTAM